MDRLRVGITGGVRVPENYNSRKVIDFCAEMGLPVILTLTTRVCISTPGWLEAKMDWR